MSSQSPSRPAPVASEREVTVVFADISGFTAMSEKLDPEAVTDIMNRCFTELEAIVVGHGGVVEKYIGDSVMAVFGLAGDSRQAAHALAAASEILAKLSAFDAGESLDTPLGVHIGLESGSAVVGVIGEQARYSLTVSGPPVALASVLEEISTVGQIFVGPKVWAATQGVCEYRALEPVSIREWDEPVAVYELVRHRHPRDLAKRDSERRQATVVFAAVDGFGEMARNHSVAERTAALNLCFAAIEAAVHAYGGVIDKYIGETAMALFGVPDAIEDAPKQAINAAIDMRKRLANLHLAGEIGAELSLRAGINSGLVIAGEIGGRIRRDYTVMGDTVNLAARLKEAAGSGEIVCGAETYRFTRADFDFAVPETLSLKGKRDPIPAFRVLSTREQLYRTATQTVSGRLRSGMIGREKELAAATRRLENLAAGEGAVLSLVGEAGLGKSRLYSELQVVAQARGLRLLEGRCLSVGKNLRFHPFVDLLRQWSGVVEEDSNTNALARLKSALAALPLADVDEVFPFVATLLGAPLEGADRERIARIDGEALERLITRAVREVLRALAQTRPLVVVFEDLHWADLSSIQLLESLLPIVAASPILFIIICRPYFPETSGRLRGRVEEILASRHEAITLERLSEDEGARLVEGLLDLAALPVKIRKWIAAKTEGNPFYIEEVIHSLIDSGAIAEVDGAFHIAQSFDEVDMPGTIQEVIMARVDRLPPPTRNVLRIASVIGRSFYYSIIHEILRRSGQLDRECDEGLRALRERELLIESATGWTVQVGKGSLVQELEYVFKHALVQETIYNSILHKDRREFHQTVGDTIESLFPDRLRDFYGMLAYHFGRAKDLHKAESYLFLAGEEAARSAASSEALSFFREAADVYFEIHGEGGDPTRKAELQKNIGLALLNTGELSQSIEHFDRALGHYGVSVPDSTLSRNLFFAFNAVTLFSQLYLGLGHRRAVADWKREQQICDTQFNRARAQITSDPLRLVFDSIHVFRRFNEIDMSRIRGAPAMYASAAGMFCYSALSFSASRKALDYAKHLAENGDLQDRFTYLSMEFIFHYLRGEWDRSLELVIDPVMVDEVLRAGQLWDVNTYVGLECDQRLRQGDFAASERALKVLDTVAHDFGFDFAAVNLLVMTALHETEARDLDAALVSVDRYCAAVEEAPLRVVGYGTKAKIHTLRGELDLAARALCSADDAADPLTTPPWHLSALATARLRLCLEQWRECRGDRSAARACQASVRKALSIARKTGIQRTEIYSLVASAAAMAGARKRAIRWWSRAIDTGTRMGAIPELARAHLEMGQALAAAGDRGAGDSLRKGAELLRGIGLSERDDCAA